MSGNMKEYRILATEDGRYKMFYEGRCPYPETPYEVWWPALRKHSDGTTWGSTLTKQEILQRLEKVL